MTYEKIAKRVKATHGWVPKTCWIADCKGLLGLPVHRAPNRVTDARQVPCPVAKRAAIFEAFRHFGMI